MYRIPMQDKKTKESLLESYVYVLYRTILADIKFQQINSGQKLKVFFFSCKSGFLKCLLLFCCFLKMAVLNYFGYEVYSSVDI